MAHPTRPTFSMSLPPTFTPHDSNDLPKTPKQEEPPTLSEPPPPPKQPYKVRRKRATLPSMSQPEPVPEVLQEHVAGMDAPVPTIEMTGTTMENNTSPLIETALPDEGLLTPVGAIQRIAAQPKTPVPRAQSAFQLDAPINEWGMIQDNVQRTPVRRVASVSSFSDSSLSSCGTSDFSAPRNDSCASPEGDIADPFVDDSEANDKFVHSPGLPNSSPAAKRARRSGRPTDEVNWTPEMDQHLENEYIKFLSAPYLTPFKTLPGCGPPLGICSKVARAARRSWGRHRATTPRLLDPITENWAQKTLKPLPAWPKSHHAARERLRKLVKSKPSLSAHYQRLLRLRSPSPFHSSDQESECRFVEPSASSFGRDMHISLATSTSASMQPQGPLAQLTAQTSTRPRAPPPQPQGDTRPPDWFARIGRSQAHQRSASLQAELNLAATNESHQPAPLASPFNEKARKSHLLRSMGTTKSLGRNEFNNATIKGPSLDPPFEIHGAGTGPRSRKRRYRAEENKAKRPNIDDVFGPEVQQNVSTVRNRGFSVGAVRATNNLSEMFNPPVIATPPSTADHEMSEAPSSVPDFGLIGSRSAPRRFAEPVPRLRSPFVEVSQSERQAKTFPRATPSNPNPFLQRLRDLAQDPQQN